MPVPSPEAEAAADLLFVFAGAPWRKHAGADAWRAGRARALVLSVGRFEWRRVLGMGWPHDGGLRALVDATPPPERHFFLVFEGDGAEARVIPRGRFGTWSEARALAALARERGASSLLVCTSRYHLPRSLLAVRRALKAEGITPSVAGLPCDEPADRPLAPGRAWREPRAWVALAREGFKLAVYAAAIRPARPGRR